MADAGDCADWPDWLAAIYGPRPEGPRRRAEALARDAMRKAAIERRLAEQNRGKAE